MSHLTTSPTCDQPATALRLRGAGRRLRRGYVTLLAIMFIMIGIVTLMLVVNWTYLVLASRATLRLSDTLALTAAPRLLDEQVLSDSNVFPTTQADDITQAKNEITTAGTGFLARNNAAAAPTLRPTAAQLTITPARVDNAATAVTAPGNFTTTPGAGQPYNTLVVEIFRDPSGANPVQLMFRGQGSPNAAKITSASYVTLDSRVVGFRPLAAVRAPVAPLALSSGAWFSSRPAAGNDTQLPDGRFEFDFVLGKPGNGQGQGLGLASSVMISLNNLAGFNLNTATLQISNGIGPADVNNVTGKLGPLTAAAPMSFDSEDNFNMAEMNAIRDAFNNVAASSNPRRAFPIYSSGINDPQSIVGFVGARIINASVANEGQGQGQGQGNGIRLRVRLQPDFIIHSTVETQRLFPGATSVPENLYIHKIRLTR